MAKSTRTKKLPHNVLTINLIALCGLTACNGDSITNITVIEAEKSAQAPLVFTSASQELLIDEQVEENTLSGGSGSGNIVFTVTDPSIASVNANTGEVTLLDDGVTTITATKAGDDVYLATSASYELRVNKYDRETFQNLSFLNDVYQVSFAEMEDNGNLFIPLAQSPRATTEVNVAVNLPADAFPLDPAQFNPLDLATYTASTSVTIYDSLGDNHIQTFYFIRDLNNTFNDWYLTTSVDLDATNSAGDFNLLALSDSIGFPISHTASVRVGQNAMPALNNGNGIAAGILRFDTAGDFTNIIWPDGVSASNGPARDSIFVTESLGSLLIQNGADDTQQIAIDFNLSLFGPEQNETTQFFAPFEVMHLEQDGYPLGFLDESQVSYESGNNELVLVDDSGRLTFVDRGETTITAIVAEDERFTEARISYRLVIQ